MIQTLKCIYYELTEYLIISCFVLFNRVADVNIHDNYKRLIF